MSRFPIFFFALLLAAFLAGGCSSRSSDGGKVDEAHPSDWVKEHPGEAGDRLVDCTLCHGATFQGAGDVVSCFAQQNAGPNSGCHFTAPQVEPQIGRFLKHPAEWGENVVAGHQTFPQSYSWTTCGNAACHGTGLKGGIAGPSCFLAQCHVEGPPAPHPAAFVNPSLHGPVARDQQFFCRNCHGRPPNSFDGGFVADPAILDVPTGTCFTAQVGICHATHEAAQAHPTNWQGSNDPESTFYVASHQEISPGAIGVSCVLCHKTDAPGTSPVATAPSCFSAQFTNADGSTTACHPGGPGTVPHPVGQEWLLPAGHVTAALQTPQFCSSCHIEGLVQPLCTSCHTAANPLQVSSGCTSCHAAPPNGNAAPNRAGGHAVPGHQNFIAMCQSCHQGVGSGTLQHFDRTGASTPNLPAEVVPNSADVIFNFAWDAQTTTCSNVICHVPRSWYQGGN